MEEIRYFMEESLVHVDSKALIKEAALKMRHHSISSILIKDDDKYIGILTDTDLVRKFASKNLNSASIPASQIATKPLITMDVGSHMEEAYECMHTKNIRHLGVTEKDEIIGILSIKDFANFYHNKISPEIEEKGEIQYFMKGPIVSIDSGETVLEAAKKMAQQKVGCLLVSEGGKVKGIFSESALTMDVIAAGRPMHTTLLSTVLVRQLITIDHKRTMSDAYTKMRDNNIRHLSISRENKIIGMLTTKDFANYYKFKFRQRISQDDQIAHYMNENLITVPESFSVQEAAKLMKGNKIGSLLVTQGDEINGIVTQEIFTHKVLVNNLNSETTLVSEIMIKPTTISSIQSMDSALSCMHENDERYLAVTKDNKTIGIISLKDLTVYYKSKFVTSNTID